MEAEALEVFEVNKKLMRHQGILYNGDTPFSYYEFVYDTCKMGFRKLEGEELLILAAAFKAMLVIIEGSQKQPPPRQPFQPRIVK